MESKNHNFSELHRFLIKDVSPKELADFLQATAMQYARLSLHVAQDGNSPVPVHSEADTHIYYMLALSEVLQDIEQSQKQ